MVANRVLSAAKSAVTAATRAVTGGSSSKSTPAKKAAAPAVKKAAAPPVKKAAAPAVKKAAAPAVKKAAAPAVKKAAAPAVKKAAAPAVKKAAAPAVKKAAAPAVKKAAAPAVKKAAAPAVKKAAAPAVKKAAAPAVKKAAAPARRATGRRGPSLVVREDESPWTKPELSAIRAEIESDIAQLRRDLEQAEHEIVDLMRDSGDGAGDDQADAGAKTYEREQELALADNAREMLRQNEHALERLDNGSYGVCESCGQPIGKLRLQAAPRATLCMPCKKKQERR